MAWGGRYIPDEQLDTLPPTQASVIPEGLQPKERPEGHTLVAFNDRHGPDSQIARTLGYMATRFHDRITNPPHGTIPQNPYRALTSQTELEIAEEALNETSREFVGKVTLQANADWGSRQAQARKNSAKIEKSRN